MAENPRRSSRKIPLISRDRPRDFSFTIPPPFYRPNSANNSRFSTIFSCPGYLEKASGSTRILLSKISPVTASRRLDGRERIDRSVGRSMEFGLIGTRRTYRSNMARYTRNPLLVEPLKRDSKTRLPRVSTCRARPATSSEGQKKGEKGGESEGPGRPEGERKGEKGKKEEKSGGEGEKGGWSTCQSAYAYASRVSNPGEGLLF